MRDIKDIIPLPDHVRAKKQLGQNFLIDKRIALDIVDALDLSLDDVVVEIGAGTGAISALIAPLCKTLYAVETDRDLIKLLSRKLEEFSNVEIVNQDILKTDISKLVGGGAYKIVANLPYYITTPVINMCMELDNKADVMVFMMQKEVADRITHPAGSRIYGSFTIHVNYRYKTSFVTKVPPESFIPMPKVDSNVLKFEKLEKAPVDVPNEEFFFLLVRSAFSQRRKKLSNSVAAAGKFGVNREDLEKLLEDLQLNPNARAEELSMQDFAHLAWSLYNINK